MAFQTVRDRALKEKWVKRRKAQREKISTKTERLTAEKLAQAEAKRLIEISKAADELVKKIKIATEQLDQFIVTTRVKEKKIEYDTNGRIEKETTEENADKKVVKTEYLDKNAIKQLTGALKDLKDIQLTRGEETTQEDRTVNIIFEAAKPEDIEGDEE